MVPKAQGFCRVVATYIADLFVLQQVSAIFILFSVFTLFQPNQIGSKFFYELLFVQIFTNIGNSRERSLQIGSTNCKNKINKHVVNRLLLILLMGICYFYILDNLNTENLIVILFTMNTMASISLTSFYQFDSGEKSKKAHYMIFLAIISTLSYSLKYILILDDFYIAVIQCIILFILVYNKLNKINFVIKNNITVIFNKESFNRMLLWATFILISEYDKYIIALKGKAEDGLIYGSATIGLSLLLIICTSFIPRIKNSSKRSTIKNILLASAVGEITMIFLTVPFIHEDYKFLFWASGLKIAINIITLNIYMDILIKDSNKCIIINICTSIFVFISSIMLYLGFFDGAAIVRLLSAFVGVAGLYYMRDSMTRYGQLVR